MISNRFLPFDPMPLPARGNNPTVYGSARRGGT